MNSFPIPDFENEKSQRVKELVLDVQKRKSIDSEETAALEKEIDQLVYQLYDLTKEEIEITENA